MNGAVASAAGQAAGSAASQAAGSAASQTAGSAASQAGSSASQAAGSTTSKTAASSTASTPAKTGAEKSQSVPNNSRNNITETSGSENGSIKNNELGNSSEGLENEGGLHDENSLNDELEQSNQGIEEQNYDEGGNTNNELDNLDEPEEPSEEPEEEGPKPGDEIGDHKKIGDDGQVEDNSKVKLEKAAVTAAATYFGGGEGASLASNINQSGMADPLYGMIDDATKMEPVSGAVLDAAAKELDEAGVSDTVNDAAATYAKAKSGDYKGAVESGKKTIKDVKKTKKHLKKRTLQLLLPLIGGVFIIFSGPILIVAICGPVLGGFLDIVEDVGEFFEGVGEAVGDFGEWLGDLFGGSSEDILNDIPGYDELTDTRKKVLYAAAIGLVADIKYDWGGKPNGPGIDGIPSAGLDCSGFVGWVYWTALDKRPSAMGTSTMVSKIGIDYDEISESDLVPGDIGLFHKHEGTNHTGIYVGNGQWIHDSSGKGKVVRTSNPGFKVFLRHKEVS